MWNKQIGPLKVKDSFGGMATCIPQARFGNKTSPTFLFVFDIILTSPKEEPDGVIKCEGPFLRRA